MIWFVDSLLFSMLVIFTPTLPSKYATSVIDWCQFLWSATRLLQSYPSRIFEFSRVSEPAIILLYRVHLRPDRETPCYLLCVHQHPKRRRFLLKQTFATVVSAIFGHRRAAAATITVFHVEVATRVVWAAAAVTAVTIAVSVSTVVVPVTVTAIVATWRVVAATRWR